MHDPTRWSQRLTVTGNGKNVIAHAGAAALRLVADRTGLTQALSDTLHRDDFTPDHDQGRVLVDAAVMMADGGNTIRGIDVLRHRRDLYGPVASLPTLSRALTEIDQASLHRLDNARAQVRAQVWDLITARHGRIPAALVPAGDLGETIVLRIDAHFIDTVSRKEHAARLRGRYGHHPIAVICDNTGECLAERLRPGNAGANDDADHIALLSRAIAQLPAQYRADLLITADGTGATHDLLDWVTALNHPCDGDNPGMSVEYSVGWPVDKHTGKAIALLPAEACTPMLAADGLPGIPATLDAESGPDTVGEIAEITHLLHHLHTWPSGLRVFVRRVKPLRHHRRNPSQVSNNSNSTCNRLPQDGATKPSPPTARHPTPTKTRTRSPPGSAADTGSTPASKTTSNTATPPARNTYPRRTSPAAQTPPGTAPRPSPATSSPGYNYSAATAHSPEPNPKPCNTRSSTPRPPSPAAPDNDR